MKTQPVPARINVKLLIILAVGMCVLAGGAYGAHKIRKRVIAERALAAGKAALAKQDYAEAAKQLRTYLSKYPDDEPMLLEYAEANLAIRPLGPNNFGAAVGAYRRYWRLRPDDAEVFDQLSQLYLQSRAYGEAIYISNQRLDRDSEDAQALFVLSKSLVEQRKYDEAVDYLEQLVRVNPAEVESYMLLSAIARQTDAGGIKDKLEALIEEHSTNQAAADVETTDDAESATEPALAILNLGLELNPQSAALYVRRSRYKRLIDKDVDAARADLEAAANLNSDNANTVLGQALEWMELGDLEKAEVQLLALETLNEDDFARHDLDPDDMLFAKFLALKQLVLLKQQPEEAAALAARISSEAPDYYRRSYLPLIIELQLAANEVDDAQESLKQYKDILEQEGDIQGSAKNTAELLEARIAYQQGRYYQAIHILEKLLVVNQENRLAHTLLADSYRATGQYRRELQVLKQYTARWPDDPKVNLLVARRNLGFRRFEDALKYARFAEQHAENSGEARAVALQARISLALQQGAGPAVFAEIRRQLDNIEKRQPNVTLVPLLKAQIAQREQHTDEAVRILEHAIETTDQPVRAAMQLVDLYRFTDQQAKAIAACEAAVEQNPDLALPRLVLARLLVSEDRAAARQTLVNATEQLEGDEQFRAQSALARLLLTYNQREQGITLLETLAAQHPNDLRPRIWLLDLPEIQKNTGRTEALVDEIKEIETEESGLNWRVQRALLQLRQSGWQEHRQDIINDLNYCVERDPGWSLPILVLGRLYELLKDPARAESVYRDFIESNPTSVDVVSRLLSLLTRQRRFIDANTLLENVPKDLLIASEYRVKAALGAGDYPSAIEELEGLVASNPNDAAALTLLAKVLYINNRDAVASFKLLDQVQALNPDLLTAIATRAAILHEQQREDEARAVLDREVERRQDYDAYSLRGQYLLFTGDQEAAEKDFLKLKTFTDDFVRACADLGYFYESTGRTEQAIALWEEGIRQLSDNAMQKGEQLSGDDATSLKLMIVNALIRKDDPQLKKKGRDLLEELDDAHPDNPDPTLLYFKAVALMEEQDPQSRAEAGRLLEQVVRKTPRNVDAHNRLIQLAVERGDLITTGELINRALGANPNDTGLLLKQAALEGDRNNLDAARPLIKLVLASEPGNLTALNLLVNLASRTGRQDDAQAGLNAIAEAAASGADESSLVILKLRCLGAQRRFDEMISALADIDTQDPTKVDALTLTATWFARTGDPANMAKAAGLLRQAIAIDPTATQSMLFLAEIEFSNQHYEEAQQVLEQILETDPDHRTALNHLAWILGVELNNPQEGLPYADRGIEYYPDDPHLLDTRGVLLTRLGELSKARADFEHCLALENLKPQTQAQALYHLGKVYNKQGDHDNARQSLTAALSLNNEHEVFKQQELEEINELLDASKVQASK